MVSFLCCSLFCGRQLAGSRIGRSERGCGGTGTHSLIPGAAAWVESNSGIDITPCHDIEGNWAPGPLCKGFNAQDPGYGGDTWANWCSDVATIGWASTCGPSLPELDNEPPTVTITNPANGTVFDEAPAASTASSLRATSPGISFSDACARARRPEFFSAEGAAMVGPYRWTKLVGVFVGSTAG